MTAVNLKYCDAGRFSSANDFELGICRQSFEKGETYRMTDDPQRSEEHHNWFFAVAAKAWENLPEKIAPRYPSPEHLRKSILVKIGHCDIYEHALESRSEARALAMICRIHERMTNADGQSYAVLCLQDTCLRVATAKSIKLKRRDGTGLSKEEFKPIAEAFVHELSGLLGCDAAELLEGVDRVPAWLKEIEDQAA